MSWILRDDITDSHRKKIAQFGKQFEAQVRIYNGVCSDTYDTLPETRGSYGYDDTTGIYKFHFPLYVKKWTYVNAGTKDVVKVEYKDFDGNWIFGETASVTPNSSITQEFEISLFAKEFRLTLVTKADPSTVEYPTTCYAFPEQWIDVTRMCIGNFKATREVDPLGDTIKLPHVTVGLENSDGKWNKYQNQTVTPQYHYWDSTDLQYGIDTGSLGNFTDYKTSGNKCMVLIKFYGKNWEDSDWIINSIFNIRKFTNTTMTGESAWTAKTPMRSPMVEGVYPDEVVVDSIARDGSTSPIQIARSGEREVLTSENEYIGDLIFYDAIAEQGDEVLNQETMLDTSEVIAHCQDDKFIYFAREHNYGGYQYWIRITRMTHSGDGLEHVGLIRPLLPGRAYGSTQYDSWGNAATVSTIRRNEDFHIYIRNFDFVCDEEYFYCSYLAYISAKYSIIPSVCKENALFRLRKDGVGWGNFFTEGPIYGLQDAKDLGSEVVDTNSDSYGNKSYSFGFGDMTHTGVTYVVDEEDWPSGPTGNPAIHGPLMLFDDAGTEKILSVKRVAAIGGTGKVCEFWKWPKDLSTGPTKMADVGDGYWILSMCKHSDLTWFCCFRDNNASGYYNIGVMDRDYDNNFYVKTYGESRVYRPVRSLSIIGDSLWGGGNEYLHGNEEFDAPGLRQLYRCMFKLNGTNIIHELHDTNNDYLSHRLPVIKYQGTDLARNEVAYGQEYLVGDEYVNIAYVMNLRTGYISFRQVFPTIDVQDTSVYISYDFVNSFSFFSMEEEESRLGPSALGKISQFLLGIYGINEYGMIEKIPFTRSQFISMRHSVIEYQKETDDDGEEAMYTVPLLGTTDYLTAFQFTPDYDGFVDAVRIPIRLTRVGDDQSNPWVSITYKIWIGGPGKTGGGDFSGFGSSSPYDDPDETILKSTWELALTTEFFIDKTKVPGSGTTWPSSSPYVWRGFDLSTAGFEVVAGKTYAICFQAIDPSVDNYWYEFMTKKVDPDLNQSVRDACPDSSDLPTRGSEAWELFHNVKSGVNDVGEVVNTVVEIRKKNQVLSGTNIVDSLNPNIDSGFVSKIGGSDSTIKVTDLNYSTVYPKDSAYSITYTSSEYWINFLSFTIDDVIIVHWFESRIALPLLTDSKQSNLSESSSYGDDTAIRSCTVIGEKKLPADVNVRINKIYSASPGSNQELLTTNDTTREAESSDVIKDWDEAAKKYIQVADDDLSSRFAQYKKFAFKFKDPFISGTTGWRVKYGKGAAADTVNKGQLTAQDSHDVPLFYRIWFEDGEDLMDEKYYVMFKKDQYKQWRLATEDDRSDMDGNLKLGIDPDAREAGGKVPYDDLTIGTDDIWNESYFTVKHMNEYYGENILNFVAYLAGERKFYINSDGQVVEDAAYGADDTTKNPSPTNFPGKPIVVTISPQDFAQNPMFEYHSVSEDDGYWSGANPNIDTWASMRIDRADIMPLGVNVNFSNWTDDSQFVGMEVFGYPINQIRGIRYRKTLAGAKHADAKRLKITNDLIGNEIVAKLKCDQIIDLWGDERNILSRTAVYNPEYYTGMIIRLSSEYQDQTEQLFYVLGLDHSISSDGMRTKFTRLLEI